MALGKVIKQYNHDAYPISMHTVIQITGLSTIVTTFLSNSYTIPTTLPNIHAVITPSHAFHYKEDKSIMRLGPFSFIQEAAVCFDALRFFREEEELPLHPCYIPYLQI